MDKSDNQKFVEFIKNISPTCRQLVEKIRELKFRLVEKSELSKRSEKYYGQGTIASFITICATHEPKLGLGYCIVLKRERVNEILSEDKNDTHRIEFDIAHEIGHLIKWREAPKCAKYWSRFDNGRRTQCFYRCKFDEMAASEEGLKILSSIHGNIKNWLKIDDLKEAKKIWKNVFCSSSLDWLECNSAKTIKEYECDASIKPCPKDEETKMVLKRIKKLFFEGY